jgi:hypothetical protein
MPSISKEDYLRTMLNEEYYPIRDRILEASPRTFNDPETIYFLTKINKMISKYENQLSNFESQTITNNLINVINISDKFVYELCRSSDLTLPLYGSEKHLNLIARLESYLKFNKNSDLKISYEEFVEILTSLNLERKIDNYYLPYLINNNLINKDINYTSVLIILNDNILD